MLIGIVGKANVGKSTFFKACTLADVEIANYPFTTIKPNIGVGYVRVKCPCKELKIKCSPKNSYCKDGQRFVPIGLLDVAGLVPGAHAGRGLGNKFLDDLRRAHALVQVIDASGTTDAEGKKTTGYDPSQEIRFLEKEISLWFANIIKKHWEDAMKHARHDQKKLATMLAEKLSGLRITEEQVKQALKKTTEPEELARELQKTSKPTIIAANKVDLKSSKQNIERMKKDFPEKTIIPCCAEAELALREANEKKIIKYTPGEGNFEIIGEPNEKQKKALEFIKKILSEWGSSGVQECLNKTVFETLKLKVVYPVYDESKYTDKDGNVLPDALLLPEDATALDLAHAVHTDIGAGFVKAIDAKTKMTIGRDHVLKDGDIVKIHSTA